MPRCCVYAVYESVSKLHSLLDSLFKVPEFVQFMDWDAFNGGRINTGCEDSSVRSKLVASNPRLVTYFVSCSFLLIFLKVKAKYMLYVCSQLHADTGLLFLLVTI